ncbi:hypothetical protein [Helicobacter sp. MIT 99-5507]|uniref:hypothetical protein n=1 Tax=Helicobacter sp. MIT 99-5507 TaxID=152489 RepID=UPI000E1F3A3C|nr:hypothetical protein [Helicobacter sp. MIT 99-5507]RDU57338.1 hypothetical protein CQA42_05190 [Helicobacter sp. MIT 99-5507]
MNNILLVILFLLFAGCSQKQYFTPSKDSIVGKVEFDDKLESHISQSNKNGALLSDGTLIAKDGIYNINLKENYTFLNINGDLILVGNYETNTLSILNKDGKELKSFTFEYMPISASIRDNILAAVLADNSFVLWDTNVDEKLFSSNNSTAYAINSKVASPLFIDDMVVFPAFDGKVVILNLNNFQILNTIAISSEAYFNNIIYLASSGKNLIIATSNKLMTFIDGKDFSKDLNISDILFTNNKIYILSLEGEVIEFDLLLNELNKAKFQYANLSSIIISDNIYTLESQGYMIKIDPNSFVDSIYKIDIDEYKNSFYTDDVIYYDNRIIRFPK